MSRLTYSTAYGTANNNAMAGGGVGQVLSQVRDTLHKLKPASTANVLANLTGTKNMLNSWSNGTFGRVVDYGIKKGYGAPKKKKSGKKRGKK